jgi:DNA-directed RNA polymerase omega subunit
LNRYGNIDSKFRFVIVASKRAKQLLRGAKPKLKTKARNPIRIAQTEVRLGLVEYEILPTQNEEIIEQEERVFVGEGLHEEAIDVDVPAGKDDVVAEEAAEGEVEEETEEDEDDEEESGDAEEDKDE